MCYNEPCVISEGRRETDRMVRKKDLLIVLGVLLVAAAFIGASFLFGERNASLMQTGAEQVVRIYVGSDLYATVPLGEPQEIRVEQENGCVNVVAVTEDGAYMKSSSCDNQLCVQQGMVTLENWQLRMLGRQIICLPNQVVVEIASQTQSVPQGDQPDV